jgi:hypothetical protein|tara:strand:- start:2836 stop:4284 length:1449 start_codon:yes stop_codon:yes gene_type:complete
MLNPFFTQGTSSEQNLVQDLINEQLRMYGVDIFYLPRKYVTQKSIIKEVVQSTFDTALPLEAYVDNYDQYSGAGNLLTKFGIQSQDEVRLIISRERFENYITPLIEDQANIKLSTRPKSGDLIWFPLDDRVYEIKDIEYAKPYYQLQDLYIYELYCELFRYEDEVIATGIDEIDNNLVGDDSDGLTDDGINTIQGVTQTLTLVGTGATATAITGIVTSGGVRLITITNRGSGYIGIPTVGVSSAPSGGTTGIATVGQVIGGIVVCNNSANPRSRSIQRVDISNPGAGYTIAPGIRFIGGSGVGAAATSKIGDGVVGVVTVQSGGSGYTTSPTITFNDEVFLSGVTTVSAAATAVLSASGSISAINLTNAGLGYSSIGSITISAPDMDSSGDFIFNEIVTGSLSGTTGRVRTWDSTTNILEVASVSGTWTHGEDIVGATSGASHALRIINLEPDNDEYADNLDIENAADNILDFSEQNPFGIP